MKRLCHCGAVVAKTPCDKCREKRRGVSLNHAERYDSKWRRLSERYRHDNPICEDCDKQDIVEPATEVHHIIPISDEPERRLDVNNLVSLCHRCHHERHRELRRK